MLPHSSGIASQKAERTQMEILNKKTLRLSLQFFAEGAEGGGANGEGTAPAGGVENGEEVSEEDLWLAEMEQKYGIANGVASAQAVAKVNATRSVAHSEEAAPPEPEKKDEGNKAEPNTEKTPEQEFDELIRSDKFKEVYTKKISAAVQDRHKHQTDAKAEAEKYRGALVQLAAKYGKDPNDVDGIIAAISADDSLLEDEAYRQGKSVAALRSEINQKTEKAKSDGELARLRAQVSDLEAREKARNDANVWAQQAQETKKIYGDNFDLKRELANPEFMKYLQRDGKSVTEAFELTHYREIIASQIKAVERRADENAAKAVAANKNRIRENANMHRSSEPSRIDPANMTEEDYRRIDDMIARGEKVTLDYFI
jgi:hypothetical protein